MTQSTNSKNRNHLSSVFMAAALVCFVHFSPHKVNAQPYVGEIRIFAGEFAPNGWMFCEGQQLPISENEVLFQLIGTTYGGDGQVTFQLPDLRGRVPLHQGTGPDGMTYIIGEMGGLEQVTLTTSQIPIHSHALVVNTAKGESVDPSQRFLARNAAGAVQYGPITESTANPSTLGATGGNQPHENRQPYLALNYIISLFGVFPSPTMDGSGPEYLLLNPDHSIVPYDPADNTERFLSQILIMSYNFTPKYFVMCNGQLLPINQNQALFSLLGTTYGGNGQTNFALPNLKGRVPVGSGNGWNLGESGGSSSVTLTPSNLPEHNHSLNASGAPGNSNSPEGGIYAINATDVPAFSGISSQTTDLAITASGGSQPHENMQPFTTLTYCIALIGVFPSPSKGPVKQKNSNSPKYSDAFLAEVIIMPTNFAPDGYERCDGQSVALSQNTALFSLLGYNYGGAGNEFRLPDLQGRLIIHPGQGPGLSNYELGETGGEEYVTLTESQIPSHNHLLKVAATSTSDSPSGSTIGPISGGYLSGSPNVTLNNQSITRTGSTQPHRNVMPSLCLNFFISEQGIFPQRP